MSGLVVGSRDERATRYDIVAEHMDALSWEIQVKLKDTDSELDLKII